MEIKELHNGWLQCGLKSVYSFVRNVQTILLVGTNLFDRNYDRYDRNYDRYDRNYDRYDRNYNRLKIKFLFSFWGNYPFPTIRRLLNKVILSHTYENTTYFSQFLIVGVTRREHMF